MEFAIQLANAIQNSIAVIYKVEKQQGPMVQHREQYSISCNNLHEKTI